MYLTTYVYLTVILSYYFGVDGDCVLFFSECILCNKHSFPLPSSYLDTYL